MRYTADHTGYNADVQYEDSILEKPFSKSLFQPVQTGTDRLPQILQNAYSAYPTDFLAKNFPLRKIESATVQSLTLKSAVSNYLPNPVTISPLKLQSGNSLVKLVVNHHGSSPLLPQYYKSDYLTNYVPTVAPFPHQNYVSSTPPPQYLSLTSTPLYPIVP